jgi:hypothetical protein
MAHCRGKGKQFKVSTRAHTQQAATLTAAALKRSRQVPNTLCMLPTSLPVRVALDCCHPLTPYHIHQPPIHPWHTTDDALPHSTHELTHQPPVPSLHTTTNTLRCKRKKRYYWNTVTGATVWDRPTEPAAGAEEAAPSSTEGGLGHGAAAVMAALAAAAASDPSVIGPSLMKRA